MICPESLSLSSLVWRNQNAFLEDIHCPLFNPGDKAIVVDTLMMTPSPRGNILGTFDVTVSGERDVSSTHDALAEGLNAVIWDPFH